MRRRRQAQRFGRARGSGSVGYWDEGDLSVVGRDLWGNRGGSYGVGLDTVMSKVAVALRVWIDGWYKTSMQVR